MVRLYTTKNLLFKIRKCAKNISVMVLLGVGVGQASPEHPTALSLDGGGVRCLMSLMILEKLEEKTGKHTTELFDMIGGTSAGGMCAVLLSLKDPKTNAPKYTAHDLVKLFKKMNQSIFISKYKTLLGVLGEKYKVKHLKKMMDDLTNGAVLADTVIPVLTTAFKLNAQEEDRLKLFSSLDTPMVRLTDAVLATIAALHYFRPHLLGGEYYGDGGYVAQNPTPILIQMLKKMYPDYQKLTVLSLGTGIFPDTLKKPKSHRHASLVSVAKIMPRYFISSQQTMVKHYLESLGDDRIAVIRMNPIVEGSSIPLDDTSKESQKRLESAVNNYLNRTDTETEELPLLDQFIQRL